VNIRTFAHVPHIGLAPRLVALAVLVASLVGGSVAFSVISSARRALRNEILDTHLVMADLIAGQTAGFVADVQHDAVDLAERPEVRLALDSNDFNLLDVQLAGWQANRRSKIDGLAIYSLDGTMLATGRANRALVGTQTGNNEIIQHVVATGQPDRGQPIRSKTTGHPIVPMYVAVRSATGEVQAVLSATLSLESLTNTLTSLQLTPNSRVSMTDNETGLLLVNDDQSRILTSSSSGRNAASQHARAGDRGAMENVRSTGEATLAAYSPVPGIPWAVLLQEPSDAAFAPIEAVTRQALVWVGVAMLLAGLVAAGVAASMVRPLRKLRATAERMAGGDFGRRTGVRRGDEIGDLGHAFDRMAEQLQDNVEELTRQALNDTLTSLPNRVLLRQRLEQAIASADYVALLVMDLDRFKEVNDTLGHSSGDALLQQLGLRLHTALRKSDTIARLGGDEFAIVLPGATQSQATSIGEALLKLVGKPFDLDGRVVTIGASIGIASVPEHGPDADTLLRCADVAMYVAKRSGQGVSVYAAAHDEHTPDRLALIGELSDAIEHSELSLVFQPLIDCQHDQVIGVEALARWPHPRHGFVPPDKFVPLAEQTGLIKQLSRWVLESALRQHQEWRKAGLDVPVSVNLSMRDLHDPSLPETVAGLLHEFGTRPGGLRLEITESSLMLDPGRALETLNRLRGMGVDVSIDDFGTGYSSLAYLKQLPVDELKIDRSFVRDVAVDDSDLAIVRSTIDLAHNLGLSVVAEGVEDEASLALLRGLGCDKVQGYLFSPGISANDLTRWLVQRLARAATLERAA
jgi:diguanylate cyclase (GGDEF)-like protein